MVLLSPEFLLLTCPSTSAIPQKLFSQWSHIIVAYVSLETESRKCETMHLLSSSPHLPEDTPEVSLLRVHSYQLLPTHKEGLCTSNCERTSKLHPFPVHKWLKGNPWNPRIVVRYTTETFLNSSTPSSQLASWYRGAVWALHLKSTCL